MEVFLQEVTLGDRGRRVPGWLVSYEGAVRGVLSRGASDIVPTVACDRRLQTDDLMVFSGMMEARAWLTRHLAGFEAAPPAALTTSPRVARTRSRSCERRHPEEAAAAGTETVTCRRLRGLDHPFVIMMILIGIIVITMMIAVVRIAPPFRAWKMVLRTSSRPLPQR